MRPASELKLYEEPPIGDRFPRPPPTLQESTVDTLNEQKQSGQISKPLEMLMAHLLVGGRATLSGTYEKDQQNQIIPQDVRNDIRTAESIDFNEIRENKRNDKRNDIGLEHVLEFDDLSAQDD